MSALPPLPGKFKAVAAFGVSVLVFVVISAVYGGRGWVHLQDLAVKQRALEDIAFRLQQETSKRQQHLHLLANDDSYVEKLARERLGWIKPGETVYRVRGVTASAPQMTSKPSSAVTLPRKATSSAPRQSRARH